MSPEQIGMSILIIGFALLVGKWIRTWVKPFQKWFIPTSIITGLLLLLLGEEVLGAIVRNVGSEEALLANGLFPEFMLEVWGTLPGLLITVIFASLFLGKEIPGVKKIWEIAGPQLTFGQMMAWGQYVLGILLAVLVLVPLFDMPPEVGALIEIAFEGGHGTAAGLSGTFEQVGFEEGTDLALGLATVSMLSGVLICIFLINWGARNKRAEQIQMPDDMSSEELTGIVPAKEQESAGKLTTRPESIETLSLHIGFVALSILIGYLVLEGFVWLEQATWGQVSEMEFMSFVPLFTFAMLGSVLVQVVLARLGKSSLINRGLILRIQGLALDFLIISALGTLSLSVIGDNLIPFLMIAAVGLAWSVFTFMVLAPRMIPKHWFERGMADLGQSLGMTATGLLMLRIVDGDNRTGSVESFGYKQLLFEPILGGGLFTALSVPLIFQFGPYAVLIGTSLLTVGWLALGLFYFGRKK
ncbi:sodium/glutamate symporter [Paenibacillus sp. JCM 10914]|uniref:sodium/glutamate symporter n=1 Tax=Paenibacillus sp. JCM 10914 TaxID=1236974 RepID=UPI0003CC34D9|nr:hypothetical protein [Paenibacillus sp. JCM 10914]GAE05799.1 hypothetical protein JCM10914_1923 [Paenibacillus sp. JCM 10914]